MRRHGFNSTYAHGGCRCKDCTEAHARSSRESAERCRERLRRYRKSARCPDCGGAMSSGNGRKNDPKRCDACQRKRVAAKHGTLSKYRGGCRCSDCTRANTDWHREYMRRRRALTSTGGSAAAEKDSR